MLKYDLRYLSLRSSMFITYPRLFKSEEIQIGKSYWIRSTTKNKVINARDYLLKYANFKNFRFSDQCWIHTITVKTIICDQFWIRRIPIENDYFFCSHFRITTSSLILVSFICIINSLIGSIPLYIL